MQDLMRSAIRTATLLAALLLAGATTPALAEGGGKPKEPCPDGQAWSQLPGGVWICAGGTDTEQETEGPKPGNTGGGGTTCPSAPDGKCTDDDGRPWLGAFGAACYGDSYGPVEEGEVYPDSPAGYLYVCIIGDAIIEVVIPAGEAPVVDPVVLANEAVDQLPFAVPEISMAPQDPQRTTVGLETWLWLPEGQMDSLSLTVSAGNTSVTVTATPSRVDWDLTEGSTSCYSAGRPWVKGMSSSEQTDCSYTFSTLSRDQPDGKYPVSVTIVYDVTWTCSGTCLSDSGDLGEVPSLTSSAAIEVIERQTVVKRH